MKPSKVTRRTLTVVQAARRLGISRASAYEGIRRDGGEFLLQ
jgi:predicted DNA-binding transcriptional regulator AlpA